MPEEQVKEVPQTGYATGTWADHTNYMCGYCEFKTLDEEEMQIHVQFHVQAGDAEAPLEIAAPEDEDQFGNKMTESTGEPDVPKAEAEGATAVESVPEVVEEPTPEPMRGGRKRATDEPS